MKYMKEQNDVEITKAREMAEIEIGKFENTVKAVGADTLRAIAVAGPEMQVCKTKLVVFAIVFVWLHSGGLSSSSCKKPVIFNVNQLKVL